MKTTLPELKTTAMRQSVADILRKALLSGDFLPGEELSETSLASQLKVSRGPIREALLILSEEGLVTHSQNRGFSVLELSEKDLKEILQVRLPLETLALSLARERVSTEDLKLLARLSDNLLQRFRDGNFRECVHHDLEFHRIIWEKSENAWLVAALKRIMVPFFTFTMVYRRKDPQDTYGFLKQIHQVYLQYLKGKSSQSAEECVRQHLSLG